MADNNDVLDRADSLITKRRRTFIAARREASSPDASVMPKLEEIVFAAAPSADDEDLPVLTEVVPPEAAVSEASADRFDETLMSILVSDVAHAIEHQLAIELPTLIEASLLAVQEELRSGICTTVELALRDFLARRQQLRLPLDEPNRSE